MATVIEMLVPDIGVSGEVTVIEVMVKSGDTIAMDQQIITLEGEKASMEIPATQAGVVEKVAVKVGDKVQIGSVILTLQAADSATAEAKAKAKGGNEAPEIKTTVPAAALAATATTPAPLSSPAAPMSNDIYASPSVRRLAAELDISLHQIAGTGRKNRIQKSDLVGYVKQSMRQGGNSGVGLPQPPVVDFNKFGATELQPLSKIKKYTAQNLHRNWLLVPHVTQFEEADITELENFRKIQQQSLEKENIKLTPLVFLMKAVVATLKKFPQFNASLDVNGENLVLKKYFHIGVAVDTPDGLVVPVIRDVDQKNLVTLAKELAEVSAKARAKQLIPADMQGSSFTISSLGGIGGTAFTPIVNLPDVAILGVSKSAWKPVWQNNQFVPRLMLPLSLSYDHRVIDGAEGARFIVQLAKYLTDIRLILM